MCIVLVLFMAAFIKVCAVHTPSSKPAGRRPSLQPRRTLTRQPPPRHQVCQHCTYDGRSFYTSLMNTDWSFPLDFLFLIFFLFCLFCCCCIENWRRCWKWFYERLTSKLQVHHHTCQMHLETLHHPQSCLDTSPFPWLFIMRWIEIIYFISAIFAGIRN